MKKLFGILMVLLFLGGCSISEDADPIDPVFPPLIEVSEIDNGVMVTTGIDYNLNGVIDQDEITNIEYIYNGENGQDGTNGSDGTNGTDGEDGQDGSNGADGSNGEDGSDGIDGISVGIRADIYKGEDCEFGGIDVVTWSYITATGEVIEGTEKHNIICAQ